MIQFSIGIPSYPPHFKYINSLIEQINSFNVTGEFQIKEIIISASETEELIITTKSKYPIILDLCKEKCNEPVNRNRVWKKVTGDWIVFLDSDDWYHPDKILVTYNALKQYPDADCIVHTLKYANFVDEYFLKRIRDIKIIQCEEIKKETFPDGVWYECNNSYGGCSLKMPATFSSTVAQGISTVRSSSTIRFKEEYSWGCDGHFCRQHVLNNKLICIDEVLMYYRKPLLRSLSNFTSPLLNNEENIEKIKNQLKEEKIVNIPGAISKEILTMARPLLDTYKYWAYSIKNSSTNGPKEYINFNDPEISNQFKKCKSDYDSLLFSYRFKKAIQSTHYKTCRCIVCKITETIKSFPFIDILSKILGCNNLIPGEIFMSNYGENDFLNLHHDKAKGDFAVTISFTYDWNPTFGGVLHFTDANNNIYKSVVPREGDINIFLLEPGKGLNHFVSPVTTNKNRYMISAWYSRVHEVVKNPLQPIHFCSFATSFRGKDQPGGRRGNEHFRYDIAVKRLQIQAEESGFFNTIDIYNEENCPGIEKYSEFIQKSERGYGYWIWKPLVILDMMNKFKENSVIIYADSGYVITRNNSTVEIFNKYITDVNSHPSHRLGFLDEMIQCHITKQDLFEYMNMNDDKYKNSNRIYGGLQILLNNSENRKLIEEWLEIMNIDNHHFLDDTSSKSKNAIGFKFHLHDESIMGLLKKKYGYCEEECTEHGKVKQTLPFNPSYKRNS
jgi:glycosyltransferase involved in cell wall biosynthesis